jgi:hypothetical protein
MFFFILKLNYGESYAVSNDSREQTQLSHKDKKITYDRRMVYV